MHNPAVVKRAQEEIDHVVGAEGDVVPSYEHLAQLPYCLALVKEVLRYASTPTSRTSLPLTAAQLGPVSPSFRPSSQYEG